MRRLPLPVFLFAVSCIATTAFPQQPYAPIPPRETSFDAGWQFHLGDAPGAEKPDFQEPIHSTDASPEAYWRDVDLPHDYAIEGAFDPHSPAGGGGGYLTAGTAWYRKTFTIPEAQKGMSFTILFDGVYMDSDVWLNGVHLGNHPYGYTSFSYDLTPHMNYGGKPNLLAVRVHVQQPSSRWYSGAGIYRHVCLITTNPVHIDVWGVAVSTPKVAADSATVHVVTSIYNGMDKEVDCTYKATILDAENKVVASGTWPAGLGGPIGFNGGATAYMAHGSSFLYHDLTIPNPRLWSPETPVLYHVKSEVLVDGKIVDAVETAFGIRTVEFTADKGLLLNGKPFPIHGVCDHHDLGCLGSAAYRRGIERQLEILKTIGVNAIRTSHNPPSPELLDLCDSMGFLVMDEAFDEWKANKTRFGYGRFFDAWSNSDLTSMIERDRNHPSIVLWSIGNEIPEQNSPDGDKMAKSLADIVHHEAPERRVTSACNMPGDAVKTGFAGALDVLGINYNIGEYNRLKGRPLVASETASAISTRGEYNLLPAAGGRLEIKAESNHQMTSYDTEVPGWATNVETSLTSLRDAPWVAGQFVWTGFDYIGEPTPFGWPSRSSYFGIFDTCGFPKDRAYLYQSQWTTKPMVHLFPHWNWEGYEGKEIPVRCYTNADSVELFLNGKSLGVRDWKGNKTLHLEWLVPYAPGVLKAVATKGGKVVATDEIHTAGPPAKIVLQPGQTNLVASGQDLCYVTVLIEDKAGNICPNADNTVKFAVTSSGIKEGMPLPLTLVATDNGDATDVTSFQSPERKAFHGMALAVVRSGVVPGARVILEATSPGLAPAKLQIGTWPKNPL